jgi:hypothetical protein
MKKTAARFVTALFLACLFGFTIYVSAENVATKQFTVANAVHLAKYLIGQETSITTEYDINQDNSIDVRDLTLLKRQIISGTPAVSTETTTFSSETTSEQTQTTTTVRADPIVERQIQKSSVTDTEIPDYKEDLYEVKDSIYLFKSGNTTYAYTLLSKTPQTSISILKDKFSIVGVHFWVYEGKEKAYDLTDALPDTSGLQFHIVAPDKDQMDYDYNLVEYSKIDYSSIFIVADYVAGGALQEPRFIAMYDYNLSGLLDEEDVEIMIRYYTSDLHNHFFINEQMLHRYIDNIKNLNHLNAVIYNHQSRDIIPYAFNIPTADMNDGTTAMAATVPVQILPTTYEDSVKKLFQEDTEISDDTADYLAWDYIHHKWAKVSASSQNWKFRGAFVVYVLKNDGTYYKDWIY